MMALRTGCIVLALVTGAILVLANAASAPEMPCMPNNELKEQIRGLVIAGFQQALKEHTEKMFDNWLKDYNEEPARAARGTRNGISAYVRAYNFMMKWDPPLCSNR